MSNKKVLERKQGQVMVSESEGLISEGLSEEVIWMMRRRQPQELQRVA